MANRENKVKVQQYLDNLNSKTSGKPWIAGDGFHVLTGFDYGIGGDGLNNATFYGSAGYPVKIFINADSGEVKLVGAFKFKD